MIRPTATAYSRLLALIVRANALTLLLLFLAPCLRAQQDAGATTPSVAPGSPAGSYALSGFETVNLYNGNLNFLLPLMQVGGRGTAGYTMTLPIEIHWKIAKNIFETLGPGYYQAFYAPYNTDWYAGDKPGYGVGKLIGRVVSYSPHGCNTVFYPPTHTLTRLSFVAADGTEYELRDQLYDGQPHTSVCTNPWGLSRGKVFKSADGTAVTFISDNDIIETGNFLIYASGHLMMPDGTRYRIDSGNVTWIRDRNGNKVSFTYDSQERVTSITDSLNRQINISYYNPPSQAYDRITYTGYNNASREIRVYYASLSTVLRDPQTDPIRTHDQLFPPGAMDTNAGELNLGNFDPIVISEVKLPNNRSYFFKYNSHAELAQVTLPTGGKYQYDWSAGLGQPAGTEGADGEWGVPANWPDPADEYTGAMFVYRRVTERRVLPDGSTLEGSTAYSEGSNSSGIIVTVKHLDSSQTVKAQDKHYFYSLPFVFFYGPPTSYASWREGREYQTDVNDAGGNLLQRVVHTWQQRAAVIWVSTDPTNPSAPPQDPRIVETTNALCNVSPNLVAKRTSINPTPGPDLGKVMIDNYNNPVDVWEYDYGPGAPPTYATRHTHTDYLATNSVNSAVYDNPPPVSATDTFIHLRSLPTQQTVYAVNPSTGTETWAAKTVYEYDNYTGANHAALVPRSNISGPTGLTYTFDPCSGVAACPASHQTRGNLTQVNRWLNSGGSSVVSTFAQYDVAGNVVTAIGADRYDGTRTTSVFDFSDCYGAPNGEARTNSGAAELGSQVSYAFPTKVETKVGSTVWQTMYTQYEFHLGKPVDAEDPNNVVSSFVYGDALDRLTQVIRANTLSPTDANKNQTTFAYTDASNLVTTTSDRDSYNDNLLKSQSLYDGLGRTSEGRTYETSSAYITAKTTYDALGRAYQVSNPYRSDDTPLWTTTLYDALSRVLSVTTPDNAAVNTYYSGNRVLVRDQAAKERLSQTNALGQLTDVWEIRSPDGATEAISFPNHSEVTAGYRTKYAYDALDDLTTVTQQIGTAGATQTRSFGYDPLRRLTQASNPESGQINYTYDNASNLRTKTDARSITITINYDGLNRPTSKTYTDSTPTVTYYYDNQSLPSGAPSYTHGPTSGRLVAVTYGGSTASEGNYFGYDTLGRVTVKYQRTGTTNYQVQATYNKAGAMTEQTYPANANRKVSYSYDQAGRLSSFTGTLGDGSLRTYADQLSYNAAGQMLSEHFGTPNQPAGLYHRLSYNNRQQLYDIRLGTSVTDNGAPATWNRGDLRLYYGTNPNAFGNDGTNNNGNVWRAEHVVPLDDAVNNYVDSVSYYSYDELNRLTSVVESPLASWVSSYGGYLPQSYAQRYNYDRYGNRTLSTTGTWGIGINRKAFTAKTANNRLVAATNDTGDETSGEQMRYDKAGNLFYDSYTTGAGTRTYDAENKMTSAPGGTYVYDGDGKRVKRTASGQEWWYVYGIDGELLAEYLSTAPTTVQKEYGYRSGQLLVVYDSSEVGDRQWQWLVQDQIGSTRMVVDKSGSLAGVKRHDYLPFGEELFVGMGVRDASTGYTADIVRQKFGSKERDGETGLDYFGARYYNSGMGRFTSVDPLMASAKPMFPQSFNRYTYVLNNPLMYIDPDGAYPWAVQIRSFISPSSVAGGLFYGDGRGASFSGTSRVYSSFTVDPSACNVSQPKTISDATMFYGAGSPGNPLYLPPIGKVGTPKSSIDGISFTGDTASFNFSHSGKDPITPGLLLPN